MMEPMSVDETLLGDVVRRVLSVTRPERIILFGSAATGKMNPGQRPRSSRGGIEADQYS
jgi:hypothetical protein